MRYYLPLKSLEKEKRNSENPSTIKIEPTQRNQSFSQFDPLFPPNIELNTQEQYLYEEANKILKDQQERSKYIATCLAFFSNKNNLPKRENIDIEDVVTKKLKI